MLLNMKIPPSIYKYIRCPIWEKNSSSGKNIRRQPGERRDQTNAPSELQAHDSRDVSASQDAAKAAFSPGTRQGQAVPTDGGTARGVGGLHLLCPVQGKPYIFFFFKIESP